MASSEVMETVNWSTIILSYEGGSHPQIQKQIYERLISLSRVYNVVNYNEKTSNVNFKELRKRLTARDNYC